MKDARTIRISNESNEKLSFVEGVQRIPNVREPIIGRTDKCRLGFRRVQVKRFLLTAVAVVFAGAANLSPVSAAKLIEPTPGQVFSQPTAPATGSPHYEWQYHYVGHHARYEGHWVLVR
jgi:hypothetical protein